MCSPLRTKYISSKFKSFASIFAFIFFYVFGTNVLSLPSKEINTTRDLKNTTEYWIAYAQELIAKQVIEEDDLLRFQKELARGRIVNIVSKKKSANNTSSLIHYQEFEKYLLLGSLDRYKLLEWIQEVLKEKARIHEEQDAVHELTQYPFQKMMFYPIPADSFTMRKDDSKVSVELDEFELMSTQVTQWQWSMVMGENPSVFKDGEDSLTLEVHGKPIQLQPNHPVEMVSYLDITKKFLPKLNELSDTNDPLIKFLIPDHQQGDKFNLPTEYQWEYVTRNLGKAQGRWHFGDDESKLIEHAWYWKNSDEKTHAVAQLVPLIINGNPFYDLYGNVWEWILYEHNSYKKEYLKAEEVALHILRGGSYSLSFATIDSYCRQFCSPEIRTQIFGFRLIRSRTVNLKSKDNMYQSIRSKFSKIFLKFFSQSN